MNALTRIAFLAARAIPGGRVLALLLAVFVSTGVMLVVADLPSKAQTGSLTLNPIVGAEVYPGQEYWSALTVASYTGEHSSTLRYSVNYGDGTGWKNNVFGFNLSHRYQTPGTYTVTIVGTDGYGLTDTKSAQVTVKAPTGTLGLTLTPAPASTSQGQTVTATGTVTTPFLYGVQGTVNFGDGTGTRPIGAFAPQPNGTNTYSLSHTYVKAGTHTVTATVSEENGLVGTQAVQVTVNALPNTIAVTPSEPTKNVTPGYLYESQGTVGVSPTTKYVDYGDGTGFEEIQQSAANTTYTLSHFYAKEGTYTVTVVALDGVGGKGEATATVEVGPSTPTPDTTAPTVTSTVPAANAKGVAPTINVKATFSEDMLVSEDPLVSSINGKTFKLFKKGSTTKIAATVSYNADSRTAKLDPNNNLRRGVTYKAVVTTGAKDVAGNQLDQKPDVEGLQQKAWLFTIKR